jgi:hypothetical protein
MTSPKIEIPNVTIVAAPSGMFVLSMHWVRDGENLVEYYSRTGGITTDINEADPYETAALAAEMEAHFRDAAILALEAKQEPEETHVLVARFANTEGKHFEEYLSNDDIPTDVLENAKRFPSEEAAMEMRGKFRQQYALDMVVHVESVDITDLIAALIPATENGEHWFVIRFLHPESRGGDDDWVKFYGGARAWDNLEAAETFETKDEAIEHAKLLAEASTGYGSLLEASPELLFKMMMLGEYEDSTFQSIRVSFKEGAVIQILQVTPTEAGWNWQMVWGEPYEWVYPGEAEAPSNEESEEGDAPHEGENV